MNILVTGGAGFIGTNLIRELLKINNVKIVSVDNYSSGKEENHIINEKLVYINESTININKINLGEFSPDTVYHFGEFSRISTSFDSVDTVFESNITGSIEVIKFCKKHDAKLIYSCSSSICGDNENDANLNPYSYCKKIIRDLIKQYATWFDLKFCICYFYNVYGEGHVTKGPYATVIGIFEEQFKNNVPLSIVLPGTQERYFTDVVDIVSGLLLLLETTVIGDDYHIGCEIKYSILEVATMFKHDYNYIPERKGERLTISKPSNKKIIDLGWMCKGDLQKYIDKIIKYLAFY